MMDNTSNMKDSTPNLNQRIASRVRDLRAAHRLSLDALAHKTGVSRSMISLIERGECSPTAVVLEKLASGLGVVLAALFDAPTQSSQSAPSPLARRKDQPEWRDPASGYVRRNVSPSVASARIQIVEVSFPAGASVAFENGPNTRHVHQQVWMLGGTMEITVGKDKHRLGEGDCLAMQLNEPVLFHNPTRKAARYAVMTISDSPSKR